MRKIEARGSHLYLNNKPIYLRGYGDDGMYPNTLSPETNFEKIKTQLKKAKDFGFNYSYPCLIMQPEEYLDAADEIGLLVKYDVPATLAFQRKGPGGLPQGISLQEEKRLVQVQWLAALRWTQNHPSIIIYSPGSEIPPDNPHLVDLYKMAKDKDPSRLVMSWSGAEGATDLSNVGTLYDPLDPSEKLHLIMATEKAWRDERGIPGIAHEFIGAETLPNPSDIDQYETGLLPLPELEIKNAAESLGIEKYLPELVANSRKLANICRKQEVEEARKVRGLAGYHIWLIQDIPGYPQGIFDPFWKPKDIRPEEFNKSNGESVLLMNEISSTTRRAFWGGEEAEFEIFVSHYGKTPIQNGVLRWKFISQPQGKVLSYGEKIGINFKAFTTDKLLNLKLRMPKVSSASGAELWMVIQDKKQRIQNDWRIWLFPKNPTNDPAGKIRLYALDSTQQLSSIQKTLTFISNWTKEDADVVITDGIDDRVKGYLRSGGRVILLLEGNEPLLNNKWLVKTQFMPRWPLTKGEDISATIIHDHPALHAFPHEGFCSYQFYHLIVSSKNKKPDEEGRKGGVYLSSKKEQYTGGIGEAFNLDRFSHRIEPIIRVFGKNENRAYLFEVKVGDGRLLVSTLRFKETVGEFPETTSLFHRLLKYVGSKDFNPQVGITEKELPSM